MTSFVYKKERKENLLRINFFSAKIFSTHFFHFRKRAFFHLFNTCMDIQITDNYYNVSKNMYIGSYSCMSE
jgi:hypothetical protein